MLEDGSSKIARNISVLVLIATGGGALIPSTGRAAAIVNKSCEGQLGDRTETIRILYFPKSEYWVMSHTALEVAGWVWTANMQFRKKDPYAVYLRNASINTPFVSISIRVTPAEVEALNRSLEANVDGPTWGTCSGGVYRLLVRHKILADPISPAQLPIFMVSKFLLEIAYRNPRLKKIEWVGRKPTALPLFLIGPSVEAGWLYFNGPSLAQSFAEKNGAAFAHAREALESILHILY